MVIDFLYRAGQNIPASLNPGIDHSQILRAFNGSSPSSVFLLGFGLSRYSGFSCCR